MIDISADKLRVFGDESFDEKGQRVAAVAGLVGTEKEWTARTGGMVFHADECETEYARDPDKTKHKENLSLYADLTQIIVKSGLRGYGAGFDIASFRNAFGVKGTEADVGYHKCFTDLISHCAGIASKEGRQIEEFAMHNREGKEYNAGFVYQYFMQRPEWRQNNLFQTQKLSFDTSDNHRIQAADLVARETMKGLDNMVGPVQRPMRGSLMALALTDKRILFEFFEEPYFADWRGKMDELEKRGGMSFGDYARWLSKTGQQDNWSNRFHFIIWMAAQEEKKQSAC